MGAFFRVDQAQYDDRPIWKNIHDELLFYCGTVQMWGVGPHATSECIIGVKSEANGPYECPTEPHAWLGFYFGQWVDQAITVTCDDANDGMQFDSQADSCSAPNSNECKYARDEECDDGGPDSAYSACAFGSDCADCGSRGSLQLLPQPPPPPPPCPCSSVHVSCVGCSIWRSSLLGVYTEEPLDPDDPGGRPKYKNANGNNFIYYLPSFGEWSIGSDPHPTNFVRSFKSSRWAICPTLATAWTVYDSGAWSAAYTVTVTCSASQPDPPPPPRPPGSSCAQQVNVAIADANIQPTRKGVFSLIGTANGFNLYENGESEKLWLCPLTNRWSIGPVADHTAVGDCLCGLRSALQETPDCPESATGEWQAFSRSMWTSDHSVVVEASALAPPPPPFTSTLPADCSGGQQQCAADGRWYCCGTSACRLVRTCASNAGLLHCACPMDLVPPSPPSLQAEVPGGPPPPSPPSPPPLPPFPPGSTIVRTVEELLTQIESAPDDPKTEIILMPEGSPYLLVKELILSKSVHLRGALSSSDVVLKQTHNASRVLQVGQGVQVTLEALSVTGGYALDVSCNPKDDERLERAGSRARARARALSGGGELADNSAVDARHGRNLFSSHRRQGGGRGGRDGGWQRGGGGLGMAALRAFSSWAQGSQPELLTPEEKEEEAEEEAEALEDLESSYLYAEQDDELLGALPEEPVSAHATPGKGGGILNLGMLHVIDCQVHGNEADLYGGGIMNEHELTLKSSLVYDNFVSCRAEDREGEGGGIMTTGGGMTIVNSTMIGFNKAKHGSGLYATSSYGSGSKDASLGGDTPAVDRSDILILQRVRFTSNYAMSARGGHLNVRNCAPGGISRADSVSFDGNRCSGDGTCQSVYQQPYTLLWHCE